MLIGLEYVAAAYGIWVSAFVFYIIVTKRRMKIAEKTLEAMKQRVTESLDNP